MGSRWVVEIGISYMYVLFTYAFKGQLNYVDNRPEQPANGKAFCENHCRVAEENGVPSGLREVLKHCGIAKDSEGKTSGIDEQKIDHTCEDLNAGNIEQRIIKEL